YRQAVPYESIDESIVDRSTILTKAWVPGKRGNSCRLGIQGAAAFYVTINIDQGTQQVFDLVQGNRIGPIGQRLIRIGVGFHEDTRYPNGNGRPRQNGNELALAA